MHSLNILDRSYMLGSIFQFYKDFSQVHPSEIVCAANEYNGVTQMTANQFQLLLSLLILLPLLIQLLLALMCGKIA